jgi:hypothetical protein
MQNLKSVHDIPRLYRRTNREPPKAPSMYVSLTIEIIHDFKQKYSSNDDKTSERQRELIRKSIESVIDSLCLK